MVAADVDGDGIVDLVTASPANLGTSINVLLGHSDGTFVPARPFTEQLTGVDAIGVADFDGDGHMDVALASASDLLVDYNPFGTLTSLTSVRQAKVARGAATRAAQSSTSALAIGDMDGDGLPDIVIGFASNIAVFTSRLDHTFVEAAGSPFDVGGDRVRSVAVGDINNDGLPDVVTANAGSSSVSIILGQPDHTLAVAPGSPLGWGQSPISVALADVNGDGRLDLLTANARSTDPQSNSASVWTQQEDGSFAAAPGSPYPVNGIDPISIVAADMNGDGQLDLVTANVSSADLGILLGQPDSSFVSVATTPFQSGILPTFLVVADFNGDGAMDVATGNTSRVRGDVGVLLGHPDLSFDLAPGAPFTVGVSQPNAVVVADFDQDGRADVATANQGSNNVTVLLSRSGRSPFPQAPGSPFAVGNGPAAITTVDLNGDGLPDLLTANSNSNDVTILLGQPDHSFVPAAGSPVNVGGQGPSALIVRDINADGLLDIVTANATSNDVSVLLGRPDHTFSAAPQSPFPVGGVRPSVIQIGDFNGDGVLDIVTANLGDSHFSLLLGHPGVVFNQAPSSPFNVGGGFAFSIAVADFNHDGLPDVVSASAAAVVFLDSLMLGPTNPILSRTSGSPFLLLGHWATSIALADLNGDGVLDLATANPDTRNVSILLGRADLTFASVGISPFSTAGVHPESVAIGDVNGDGRPDIVASGSGGIMILYQVDPSH